MGEKPDRRRPCGALLEPDAKEFSQLLCIHPGGRGPGGGHLHHRYDPPAVQSVLNQIKPKLGPGQLVIQSSTISAKWTRLFAGEVQKTGAWFLEAPFTGSKIAAEQRQTVFYLGGDPEIVEKARPVLKSLSSAILHIGPLGSASTLKLAMNLNIAGVAQTLCESLTLCRKAGIPDDIYFRPWRAMPRVPVSPI